MRNLRITEQMVERTNKSDKASIRSNTRLLRIKSLAGTGFYWLLVLLGALGGLEIVTSLFAVSFGPVEVVAVTALSMTTFALLIFAAIKLWNAGRKENYANIAIYQSEISHKLKCINIAIAELRKKQKDGVSASPDQINDIKGKFVELLDDVARIFGQLSSTRCRATIKTVGGYDDPAGADPRPYVVAFARDSASHRLNKRDDQRRAELKIDLVESNTDFDLLFDKGRADKGYFFSNDLVKLSPRLNSSSIKFLESKSPHNSASNDHNWMLPYRSAIVWPIRQMPEDNLHTDDERCVGFLAIDSESRRAFEERWDVPLGESIAESLFHPIVKLGELQHDNESVGDQNEQV